MNPSSMALALVVEVAQPGVSRHQLRALFDGDLQDAVGGSRHAYRRLLGFDVHHGVAGLHLLARLEEPFGNRDLLHEAHPLQHDRSLHRATDSWLGLAGVREYSIPRLAAPTISSSAGPTARAGTRATGICPF